MRFTVQYHNNYNMFEIFRVLFCHSLNSKKAKHSMKSKNVICLTTNICSLGELYFQTYRLCRTRTHIFLELEQFCDLHSVEDKRQIEYKLSKQ